MYKFINSVTRGATGFRRAYYDRESLCPVIYMPPVSPYT